MSIEEPRSNDLFEELLRESARVAADFDADETILETYLTGQKIEKKSSFKTRQRIKKYLKAAIANSLFGDLGFYRILHQDDKMLQKVATLETSD